MGWRRLEESVLADHFVAEATEMQGASVRNEGTICKTERKQ